MKFALALLALVATSTAVEVRTFDSELEKDFKDFLALVPVDRIMQITLEYMSQDKEFQTAVEYVQSKEFRQLVIDIEAIPEVRVLMNYLEKVGINIYDMVNKLNDILGIDRIVPAQFVNVQITGGLKGYVKDVAAVIPFDKMKALFEDKMKNSPAFIDFINQLKSDNFQRVVNAVYRNPEFQRLLKKARDAGLDLTIIRDLLYAILGIRVPDSY